MNNAKEAFEILQQDRGAIYDDEWNTIEAALYRLEHIEKVLRDPGLETALTFSEATIEERIRESSGIEKEFLTDFSESIGKLRFLISQLKEGYLK